MAILFSAGVSPARTKTTIAYNKHTVVWSDVDRCLRSPNAERIFVVELAIVYPFSVELNVDGFVLLMSFRGVGSSVPEPPL
jgi:hypothetical protein